MRKPKKGILTLLALILLFIAIYFATKATDKKLLDTEAYTIQNGETLWSICSQYRPEGMNIQEYIYNVQKYNDTGSVVYAGQTIEVLIYE